MDRIEINFLKDILYGVSVGDALGVPVEFESREYLKTNPVTKMTLGGVHDQGIGVWSDDSSLTFCLAEAIIEGYDIHNLANKFIKWKNEGYWTACIHFRYGSHSQFFSKVDPHRGEIQRQATS